MTTPTYIQAFPCAQDSPCQSTQPDMSNTHRSVILYNRQYSTVCDQSLVDYSQQISGRVSLPVDYALRAINCGLRPETEHVHRIRICGLLTANIHRWISFSPPRHHQDVILETAMDIARGMEYLHMDKITHGDLKATNVLL